MSEPFDPYYTWLGISPKQRPIDHYALLGIQRFESDAVILESAADQRLAHVRAFQTGPRGELAARILNELAAARVTLLNPDKKATYDEHLRSAGSKVAQTELTVGATVPAMEATTSAPRSKFVAGKRTFLFATIGGGIAVAAIAALVITLANQDDNRPTVNETPANNDQRPLVTAAKAAAPATTSTHPAIQPPLSETVADSSPPPATAQSDVVDLLALVDVKRDTKQGRVSRLPSGLHIVEGRLTTLALPYKLPSEYQIDMTVIRLSGKYVLGLELALAGKPFDFRIDATPRKQQFTGIGQVDGKSISDSPLSHRGLVLRDGVAHKLTLFVRANSVRLLVDGADVYRWEGDPQSLSLSESKFFDFGLFARWSSFEIQNMTIRPLNGAGAEVAAVADELKTAKPASDSAAAESGAPKSSDATPDRESKSVDSTVASSGIPRTDAKPSAIESPKASDSGTTATPGSTHIEGAADVTDPAAAAALAVFKENCYRCHGRDGSNEGGLNFILQSDKLIANKYIVAGDPSGSPLFKRLSEGSMPPEEEQPRPSADQTAAIKRWIEGGAPRLSPAPAARKWIANSDIVRAIYDDVERQKTDDRPFLRYFTLTHLYNAGLSDDELQTYRLGLSKLINSLSWGEKIVVPAPVDEAKTILRIDLRDFKWTDKTWDAIVEQNPYSIVADGRPLRELSHLTRTALPFVRGDWFVAAASVPPLYHEVLGIPETVADLEHLLRISVADDIHQLRVARAGFNKSGISRNNRLIERHATHFGAYWQSYDFGHSDGRANLFSHPLGPDSGPNSFRHDGGEIIFNLPNGLQAYMIVDGAGDRLDKAPLTIVSDPRRPDRAVANGLSCMSCHVNGIHEKADEIREAVHANLKSFSIDEARSIAATYPPSAKMRELQVQDAERFQTALKLTGTLPSRTEPVLMLVQRFETPLDLTMVAAELGIQPANLLKLLDSAPQSSRTFAALRSRGGTIQRQVLVDALDTLSTELKLSRAHSLGAAVTLNSTPPTTVTANAERPAIRTEKPTKKESRNGKKSSLSSNDLSPLATIKLSAEIPDVILAKDRRWIYLLNASEGLVQRIDAQTLALDRAAVKTIPAAERMRLTPNGRVLYVCGSPKGHNTQQESPGAFQVIPAEKFESSTRFTVPFDPWDFAPDDRGRLFATSGSAQSVPVRLVDGNKQAVVADLFLNWDRTAIRLSNDGKTLFADNSHEIHVFSLAAISGKGTDQRMEPLAVFESPGPFEISGDDRFLITAGGLIGRLGSSRDGKIPLAANLGPSVAIAVDRQSKLVFFATKDHQLKVYSTPSFELRRSLHLAARVHAMAVDTVAGRLFAAVSKEIKREGRDDDDAKVSDLAIYDISSVTGDAAPAKAVDATNGDPERGSATLNPQPAKPVPRVEASPSKFDGTNNDLKPTVTFKLGATVPDLLLGPDRRFVYFLDASDGLIRRIDTQTAQLDDTVIETGPGAQRLRLSPDGKTLFAVTAPQGHQAAKGLLTGNVVVIPAQQFVVSNRFTIPFDPWDLAPDNQGRVYIRPGRIPGKIQLVDANKQAVISESAEFWDRGTVRLSRDDKLLIVGSQHGGKVFSTSELKPTVEGSNLIQPMGEFEDTDAAAMNSGRAELSPDGKFLVIERGQIGRIGNARDRKIPEVTRIDPWEAITFDPSAARMFISTKDKQLKVYSLPAFELLGAYNLESRVYEMALDAPSGKLYAAISDKIDRGRSDAILGDLAVFDVSALVGKLDEAALLNEPKSGPERAGPAIVTPPGPPAHTLPVDVSRDTTSRNEIRPDKLFKLQAVVPAIALSRDRQELFLLNATEGQLLRLDTITMALGSEPLKLTSGADTMAISPGGSSIIIGASPQGHPKPQVSEPVRPGRIQVIDAQTFKTSEFAIPFTPSTLVADNKGLVVSDFQGGNSTLHLIDSHRQVQVEWGRIGQGRFASRLSPDGRWLYYSDSAYLHRRAMPASTHGTLPPDDTGPELTGEFEITGDGRFMICRSGTILRLAPAITADMKPLTKIEPHIACAVDRGCDRAFVATANGTLKVYQLPSFELQRAVNIGQAAISLRLDATTGYLYAIVAKKAPDPNSNEAILGDLAVFDVRNLLTKLVDSTDPAKDEPAAAEVDKADSKLAVAAARELTRAQRIIRGGSRKEAMDALKKIIDDYPETKAAERAHYLIKEIQSR